MLNFPSQNQNSIPYFIFIVFLINASSSYLCPLTFTPLTESEANLFTSEICRQIPVGVKLRLNSTGAMKCLSSTTASIVSNESSLISHAICVSITSTPFKVPGTSCPLGNRAATFQEVSIHKAEICSSMGDWEVIHFENQGAIKGPSHYPDCIIIPSEPGIISALLCVKKTPTIVAQVVESQELTCSPGCNTCEEIPTNCTSCSSPAPYLYGNECYSICPAKTFSTGNSCQGKKSDIEIM